MVNYKTLLDMAWKARENACINKSGTKVGCAIEAANGQIVCGWNIDGLWMTSLHAEVVAITQLAPLMSRGINIAVVTDTSFFSPCGSCIDWLIQFCDPNASVIIQNKEQTWEYKLRELMPHYPEK